MHALSPSTSQEHPTSISPWGACRREIVSVISVSPTLRGQSSSEGTVEGRTEAGGEQARGAVGLDDHDVFEADAVFAADVDTRLVGEGHAGFEHGLTAADEVRMLVAVEADA